MSNPEHRFLELHRESEAANRGINLTEKATHYYYRTIKNLSTPAHIKAGETFHYYSSLEDSTETTEQFRHEALSFLMKEQMVTMLPLLRYNNQTSLLELEPIFIARRDEGEVEIQDVYHAIIQFSVSSIKMYVDNKSTSSAEQIRSDLDYDFGCSEKPSTGDLHYTILTPFGEIQPRNFPFTPHPDSIASFVHDCKISLMEGRVLIEVRSYRGFLSLLETEALLRFDVAASYLKDPVATRYDNDPELKSKLRQIELEETEAKIDEFADETPAFALQRALTLKEFFRSRNPKQDEEDFWFAGLLTVESILKTDGMIQELYDKRNRERRESQKDKLFDSIRKNSTGSIYNARFFSEKEKKEIHPEVWDALLHDNRLIHSRWENYRGTQYLFMEANPSSIKKSIHRMSVNPPQESWKVFAIKHALEDNPALFDDLKISYDFRHDFDSLMGKVYIPYMPWYFKLLHSLGIPLFTSSARDIAQRRLSREQDLLQKENHARSHRIQEEEKRVREEKKKNVDRIATNNQIIATLDDFYFEKDTIPTVGELAAAVQGMSLQELTPYLKRGGYQLIARKQDEPVENQVVLHPVDHEWRIKQVHIFRSLERVFQSSDKEQIARAKPVQKRLSALENASDEDIPDGPPDAYRRLEQAMKKKFPG